MPDPRPALTRNALDALDALATSLELDGYPGLASEIETVAETVSNAATDAMYVVPDEPSDADLHDGKHQQRKGL